MSSRFAFIASTYPDNKNVRCYGGTLRQCLRRFEMASNDLRYDDFVLKVVCRKNNNVRQIRQPKTELWKLNLASEAHKQ